MKKKVIKYAGWAAAALLFLYLYVNAATLPESIDTFVRGLKADWAGAFSVARDVILAFLWYIEQVLFFIHPFVAVALIAGMTFAATKNIANSVLFGGMLMLIHAFNYWELMIYTVAMIFASVVISLIIGIPIGILMAASRRLNMVMQPVLDTMQTLPSFVYLIPAVMFFAIGKAPGLIATTIYAVPPVMRLTSHAISQVDREVREAARAFGATKWQSIFKVELPQALPTIMAGINQTTMMAVAMVVTSSLVGTKGLGQEVLAATNRLEVGRGFISGISIVFVAIIIDRISQGLIAMANERRRKGA